MRGNGSAKGASTETGTVHPLRRGLYARDLAKSYQRRPVLHSVSLSVNRGEAVGLLGPNGAGKTTCFYIITGLIAPDSGAILLDGEDVTDLPMYRRARLGIGYLPQEASIFRGLTVEQNIRAILEVAEPEPELREAMLDALLAEFSIGHLRRASTNSLSSRFDSCSSFIACCSCGVRTSDWLCRSCRRCERPILFTKYSVGAVPTG